MAFTSFILNCYIGHIWVNLLLYHVQNMYKIYITYLAKQGHGNMIQKCHRVARVQMFLAASSGIPNYV